MTGSACGRLTAARHLILYAVVEVALDRAGNASDDTIADAVKGRWRDKRGVDIDELCRAHLVRLTDEPGYRTYAPTLVGILACRQYREIAAVLAAVQRVFRARLAQGDNSRRFDADAVRGELTTSATSGVARDPRVEGVLELSEIVEWGAGVPRWTLKPRVLAVVDASASRFPKAALNAALSGAVSRATHPPAPATTAPAPLPMLGPPGISSESMLPDNSIFISYSHDSDAHRDWVRALAARLEEENFDVKLDQWDLVPGGDLAHFMESGLAGSARVIVVCTPNYVGRSNTLRGGVGYEKMIISSQMLANPSVTWAIPIVRHRDRNSTPTYLGSKVYIDFCDDAQFESKLGQLIRGLRGKALHDRPARPLAKP